MSDQLSNSDICHLWAQIVHQTGVDTYTSEEWQESYEDFCRQMRSNSQPFVMTDTLEQLEAGILRTQPVFAKKKNRTCSSSKKQKLETNGSIEPQDVGPNINADMSKINIKGKLEVGSNITENTSENSNVMQFTNGEGGYGNTPQEVKMPTADGNSSESE